MINLNLNFKLNTGILINILLILLIVFFLYLTFFKEKIIEGAEDKLQEAQDKFKDAFTKGMSITQNATTTVTNDSEYQEELNPILEDETKQSAYNNYAQDIEDATDKYFEYLNERETSTDTKPFNEMLLEDLNTKAPLNVYSSLYSYICGDNNVANANPEDIDKLISQLQSCDEDATSLGVIPTNIINIMRPHYQEVSGNTPVTFTRYKEMLTDTSNNMKQNVEQEIKNYKCLYSNGSITGMLTVYKSMNEGNPTTTANWFWLKEFWPTFYEKMGTKADAFRTGLPAPDTSKFWSFLDVFGTGSCNGNTSNTEDTSS
jgi:hypothetical protein